MLSYIKNGTTDYKIINNIGNTDNIRRNVLEITFLALHYPRESRTFIDSYADCGYEGNWFLQCLKGEN